MKRALLFFGILFLFAGSATAQNHFAGQKVTLITRSAQVVKSGTVDSSGVWHVDSEIDSGLYIVAVAIDAGGDKHSKKRHSTSATPPPATAPQAKPGDITIDYMTPSGELVTLRAGVSGVSDISVGWSEFLLSPDGNHKGTSSTGRRGKPILRDVRF